MSRVDDAADALNSLDVQRHQQFTEREQLNMVISQLAHDETRVLLWIANRLLAGQRGYGVLDIATDRRDWRKERGEEYCDALVYTACEELKNLVNQVPIK